MTDRVCSETGAMLRRGLRPLVLEYKGASLTIEMPGWYAEGSDEGTHSGEDMKVSDRALNRLKAEIDQLLPPQEIKRIRQKVGLTQEQAGELIGGGPRAFQKYEAGILSRAVR